MEVVTSHQRPLSSTQRSRKNKEGNEKAKEATSEEPRNLQERLTLAQAKAAKNKKNKPKKNDNLQNKDQQIKMQLILNNLDPQN